MNPGATRYRYAAMESKSLSGVKKLCCSSDSVVRSAREDVLLYDLVWSVGL